MKTPIARFGSALMAGLTLVGGAAAQDLVHKAPAQSRPVVITNVMIHTVTGGTIPNASIAFEAGTITKIGGPSETLTIAGAEVIDATGKHVYPGMVAAVTTLGLSEIGAVRSTQDAREVGGVTPEARAAVAVNPDSWHIPVTRRNGVLLAGVMPSGGAVPGRVSVVRLDGWTWEDMAASADAGLAIDWPFVRPVRSRWMERSDEDQMKEMQKNLKVIEDLFAEADAYFAARKADPTTPTSVRLEAVGPALRKEKPVYIRAQDLDQIQSAVSWGAKRGLKMILVGGRDATACADLLKKHDVGVIVTGTHRMPRRSDSAYDEAYRQPVDLQAAGLTWCLAGPGLTGNGNDRNLPYQASMAAAHGLDKDAALKSVTIWPAQMLGVSDRYGSLEVGKSATLILTDGDPLDIICNVEAAFIDGRRIDLTSKQTELAAKYREKYRQIGLIGPDGKPTNRSESPETAAHKNGANGNGKADEPAKTKTPIEATRD